MKTYRAHVTDRSDDRIISDLILAKEEINKTGGNVTLSRGFGTIPSIITLSLPENTVPSTFLPYNFQEIKASKISKTHQPDDIEKVSG